jgi:hypothetical protein
VGQLVGPFVEFGISRSVSLMDDSRLRRENPGACLQKMVDQGSRGFLA